MSRNHFEIEIDRVNGYYVPPVPLGVPMIDGRPLLEVVREIESSIIPPGQTHLPGDYAYHDAEIVLLPSRLLLGEAPYDDLQYGERVALLDCDCRCWGCSPLVTKISVAHETVTWTDFAQLNHPDWLYPPELQFTFDREEYERALSVTA